MISIENRSRRHRNRLKKMNKGIGTIDHYTRMALKGGDDAKTEAAKVFHHLSEQSKCLWMLSDHYKIGGKVALIVDALDALMHLLSCSDTADIVRHALMALINFSKETKHLPMLVNQKLCFIALAPLLSFHDVQIQILAARCIGNIAQHKAFGNRFVTDGALLPMLCLLQVNQSEDLLVEACTALSKCHLRSKYFIDQS